MSSVKKGIENKSVEVCGVTRLTDDELSVRFSQRHMGLFTK